jgi:glucose/arabinose dehydrogenase
VRLIGFVQIGGIPLRFIIGVVALLVVVFTPAIAAEPPKPWLSGLDRPVIATAGSDGKVYIATRTAVLVVDKDKAVPFAAGIENPGGMAAFGELLFVTDQKGVWRINRAGKAEILQPVNDGPALAGMAIDEEGRVYFAHNCLGPYIRRVDQKGQGDVVVGAKDMPAPGNVLSVAMDGYSFLLATIADSGQLVRIKLADRTATKVAEGLGEGAGMVWDKFGRLYISDGKGGNVFVIPRPGDKPILFASGFAYAGGLGLDATFKNILVADREAGTVTALPAGVPGQPVDETPMPLATAVAFPNLQWTGWKPENDKGQSVPLRPIVLTHAGDGSNRVFVATEQGVIHVFPNDQKADKTQIFLDIQDRVTYDDNQNEEGFLGLAFHPNYKKNGEFFVFYTTKKKKFTNVLSRFRVRPDDPNRADPNSEEELWRITKPFWNHDGGTICFGPDGYLYMAVGDGGSANDPFNHGQDLSKWFGKVLRIDVDHKDEGKPYAIPKDNPFVNRPGAKPEIWSYGLRNIWRMAFDRKTGALWASDVGQNLYEEIDLLVAGGNYGWNIREGLHPFGPNGVGPRKDLVEPIWEYHHDVGKSLTGGTVYRGQRLPELDGNYLYADYVSAKIWAMRYDDTQHKVVANRRIPDPNVPVMSFGEDEKGEVYFMTYSSSGRGVYWFVRPEK